MGTHTYLLLWRYIYGYTYLLNLPTSLEVYLWVHIPTYYSVGTPTGTPTYLLLWRYIHGYTYLPTTMEVHPL